MSSTEFTARVFAWLYQVNADPELQSADVKVAVQLTQHFNEKQGGRAYPGYRYIAEKVGLHKETVVRSVRRMRKRGHLKVEFGRPGRGCSNQYWMAEAPEKVGSADLFSEIKGRNQCSEKVGLSDQNHLREPQDGESPPRRGAVPAPGVREEGAAAKVVGGAAENLLSVPVDPVFDELCAVWDRGWSKDNRADRRAADRQAYAEARAAPEDILAAARAWVAAADAPRYLPVLSDWLRDRGWEKPPPKRAKKGNGKVDLVETGYEMLQAGTLYGGGRRLQ